ncbi:enoyl-CoA hydratase/isomerase family protein [Nocardia vaccinii]|uniref:enoyl-CoA hydratase/isomerase family protein n=1 Tax=Nocardia vaccinii TaxID=1822 RepID=UPI0008378ABB|nr:enoyl-CoA hydratase/isomerase family protein [Nocardia vaccinii]
MTRNSARAESAAFDTLRVHRHGRVLLVEADAPPFNYMTPPMQQDFVRLVEAVNDDATIGAVVVTGAIEGRYILHFDLAEVEAAVTPTPAVSRRAATAVVRGARALTGAGGSRLLAASSLAGVGTLLGFHRAALGILRSPAVWIAAVNGVCAGAGLELSVFFDLRIAAAEKASFSMPELSIALNPPFGGQRLAQLMNPSRALEFMLEARFYDAGQACRTGLVNRVVPDGELVEYCLSAAKNYASRPRGHVAAQKRIFNESHSWTPEDSLAREAGTQMAAASSQLFRATVRRWLTMRDNTDGDTVFLTDPQPWVEGTAIDLNP